LKFSEDSTYERIIRQTLGEVETEVSSTEKTSNRTKTKSQLPTNSIREVWTSRDRERSGLVSEWTMSTKNKNASEN